MCGKGTDSASMHTTGSLPGVLLPFPLCFTVTFQNDLAEDIPIRFMSNGL